MTSPTLSHKSGSGGVSVNPPQHSLQSALKAVDLTSESSSVLGNRRAGGGGALRKLSTSSSVSRSSNSSQSKYVSDMHGSGGGRISRPYSLDAADHDSGHHSMYDSHSQSSGSSSQHPSPATTNLLTHPGYHMGGHASPPTATAKYTSRIHG